jgi:amino acid adenylation domain-containing protein
VNPSSDGALQWRLSAFQRDLFQAYDEAGPAQHTSFVAALAADTSHQLAVTAIRDVLRSHAILRSTIDVLPDGAPVQKYRPDRDFPILLAEQGPAFDKIVEESKFSPYSLLTELPVRVVVATEGDTASGYFIAVHHVAFDRASMWHLARQVALKISDPDLSTAFESDFKEHAERDVSPATAIRSRPQRLSRSGPLGVVTRRWAPEEFAISSSSGSSSGMLNALVAFAFAAEPFIGFPVISVPVGTRPRASEAVGPFVRVLRLDLGSLRGSRPSDRQRIARRALSISAQQQAFGRGPAVSAQPPLGGGFNFTEIPPGRLADSLEPQLTDVWGAHGAELPLRLDIESAPGSWEVSLFFASELLSAEKASQVLDEFERHLSTGPSIVRASRLPVSNSSIPFARRALKSLRARETGLAVDGELKLTHHDIAIWAEQISSELICRGLQPGQVVAVHLEPDGSVLAAFLGVLLAGGIYLPLDPRHPTHRTSELINDSGASALICDDDTSPDLTTGLGITFSPRQAATNRSVTALAKMPTVKLDQAAYLIYTSGSTGRPKGVLVSHGNLLNLSDALASLLAQHKLETMLLLSSPSFDAHIWEMVAATVSGATILPTNLKDLDTVRLAYLRADLVTTTPSVLRALSTQTAHPKVAISAGEPIDAVLARRLRNRGVVYNAYGPTETSVCASIVELPSATELYETIPMGRPLDGVELYVLDENLSPVPAGHPGELFIGGQGVALGYLNNPGLTAASFLPNPFSQDSSNARMYSTGDEVVLRLDGQLTFLGRRDTQLKINGQRVELAEVQAMLVRHPVVRECRVLAVETSSGPRLCAYVVFDVPTTPQSIREWLALRLPSHLHPTWVVPLDALPLTSSGKVDTRRLPTDRLSTRSLSSSFQGESASSLEIVIAAWTEVLGAGIEEQTDVLHAGATSLDVARAVWLMRQFSPEIDIRDIYQRPIVSQHAAHLVQPQSTNYDASEASAVAAKSTPLQQQLFLMSAKNPGDVRYNVPLIYSLDEPLDPAFLQRAVDRLALEQPSLSAVLTERLGIIEFSEPLHPSAHRVASIHLSTAAAVKSRLEDWVTAPFDLEEGPLIRFAQIFGPDETYLAIVAHHAIFDAESERILQRSLSEAWGVPPDHPTKSARPFSSWLKSHPQNIREGLNFWDAELAGLSPLTGSELLPAKRAWDTTRGVDYVVREDLITSGFDSLDRLVRETSSSRFTVITGALHAVIAARTGRGTFATISPTSLRRDPRWDDTIGCFIDSIHVRAEIDPSVSVREYLQALRDRAIAAIEHSNTPLSSVIHHLRKRGYATPVSGISLQVLPRATDWKLGDSILTEVRPPSPGPRLDLQFQVSLLPTSSFVDAIFDPSIFSPSDIHSLIGDIRKALSVMLENPDASVGDVISSVDSRLSIAIGEAPRSSELTADFATLFLQKAMDHPARPAVSDETRTISYGELAALAWSLSKTLDSRGIGRGKTVAILTSRGVDAIVAMLGCLISGVTYLPLDERSPRARLTSLLSEANADLCLTNLTETFLPTRSLNLAGLEADGDWRELSRKRGTLSPSTPAYMIYTSGSSGRPKRVVAEHRNLSMVIRSMASVFQRPQQIRVSSLAPISFDASLKSITCLVFGHELVLVSHETRREPGVLQKLMRSGISVTDATPYDVEHLVGTDVETILVGGAAWGQQLWEAGVASQGFWNVYGPTECSVFVSKSAVAGQVENIGRPVEGARLYVLDSALQLVPRGTKGQLFIGGQAVSRGYADRPSETAQAFLPDPYTDEVGARMYATGDLAIMSPDNDLIFEGRLDDQVKVRGHRVEPREVATIIEGHPNVRDVVVLPVQKADKQQLVAYIACSSLAADDIRAWTRELLPDYMMPSFFVLLEKIPLTSAGKVDRQRLAEMGMAHGQVQPTQVDQVTALEGTLMRMWSSLLDAPQVTALDNFFDLGGDSITAMQLAARAGEDGWELRSADVFEAQTVRQLAEVILRRRHAKKLENGGN